MRFLTDNRAQSIQVGAVLLFGVLIILLSTWQAFVIPNQNEDIEFNHNEDVQQQMTEVRTTINSMPDSATTRSATVDLGLRYPSRTIFRNPPPVSGTLTTDGTTNPEVNISISNAKATAESALGVGDFWNGSTRSYQTGSIQYRPSYNQYDNAPTTIYEHSVLYNRFEREETQLAITDQTLIQDGRLSLTALNGSLSETRVGSTSVDFEPKSTQTATVTVEQADSDPVTIELPTRLSAQRWNESLGPGHNVTTVAGAFPDSDRSLVRISLDNRTYRLQLAKVGVGPDATDTDAEYLTLTDPSTVDEPITLEQDERREFVLEVRDKYNKPLRGETVYADAGNTIENRRQTSGDGRARFTYEAGDTGSDTVQFSILDPIGGPVDDGAPEEIAVDIEVEGDETQSGTSLAGPAAENLSYDTDAVNQGETINITEARFNNTGTTVNPRGGVPVIAGEYYVVNGSVSNPEGRELEKPDGGEGAPPNDDGLALDAIPPEERALIVNTTGAIETETLEPGEYTTFIRGQDTRGIWTNESVDGYLGEPFEVLEPKPQLTLTARTDPIDPGDQNSIDIVLEDQNGDPLNETVTVTIENGNGSFQEITSGGSIRTGENGETSVTYQSVEDDAGTTVSIKGVVDETEGTTVSDTAEFVVNDETTGSFSGTVTDSNGDPVTDEVTFTDSAGNVLGTATPDSSDGFYQIDNIEVGTYDITATADGYTEDSTTNVDINDDQTTTGVDFVIDRKTGSFSGTVTDSNGDPVTDEVTFTDSAGNALGTATPDGTGAYTITDVPTAEYDITATADGYTEDSTTNVDINDGQTTTDVDFVIDRKTGSFSGTVTDSNGDPVTDEVTFTDSAGNVLGTATPDSTGAYTITDVPTAEYDITATADGYTEDSTTNVDINDDQTTTGVDFTLTVTDADLSGVTATDIVPNAQSQMQSFEFTLESELAGGESVEILLDDAQSTSPLQVNYGNAGAVADDGFGTAPSVSVGGGQADVTYVAPETLSSGTTIEVRVDGIRAGDLSDQSNPYNVTFNRSDRSTTADTEFSVAPNTGDDPKIENLTITDIGAQDATQVINFTVTEDMEPVNGEGEHISIDLTDAFEGGVGYANRDSIQSAKAETVEFLIDAGAGYANINFVAPTDSNNIIQAGEEVEIVIEGIDSELQDPDNGDTYAGAVSRGTGGTTSDEFDVGDPANLQVTDVTPQDPVPEGQDLAVEVTVENQGDLTATRDVFLDVDRDQDGVFDVEADTTQVNLAGGETGTVTLTYTTQSGDASEVDVRGTTEDDPAGQTATATVNEPPFFDVNITSYDQEVTEGDDVVVQYSVQNTGDLGDTQDIQFTVRDDTGTQIGSSTETGVTLNAGDSFTGSFTYQTQSGDSPEISVEVASQNDSTSRNVTVNEALQFEYSSQPTRIGGGNNDGITFEIQNNGNEVTIAEFQVRDNPDYSTYNSYSITAPQVQNPIADTGTFNTGERISHTDYTIGAQETATIELDGFGTNMNNENFQFVIYTDDGRSYEFQQVTI